jgi:hypothetical protein
VGRMVAPINSADDLAAQTEIGNLIGCLPHGWTDIGNLIARHGFPFKGYTAWRSPSTQVIQTPMGAAIGRLPNGEARMVGYISSANDLNTGEPRIG